LLKKAAEAPTKMKANDDVLRRYEEEIRTLREENELLRRSARAFGALAERLHVSLQEERRRGQDRRLQTRPTPDRRQVLQAQAVPNLRSKR
jgi:hypothetical protein